MAQTQQFQAEIQDLLNLMIHSLYSHREIFLRELISNSSDAIDKLKFEALAQPSLVPENTEFQIRIEPDIENNRLIISDNGIGMSYEEVMENIGTIARSGTKKWAQMTKEISQRPELIGQFGVGFYSAFMVADKVILHTMKAGSNEAVLWESTGDGTYKIDRVPKADGFGTKITLQLKKFAEEENVADFTAEWTLKETIKKYSDFIAYPIKMKVVRQTPELDENGKPIESKTKTTVEDQTLNSQKALWTKPASEIKPEEYNQFYQHLAHDWTDPLKTVHYRAEGTLEYTALLYVPAKRPWNYHYRDSKVGLNLYVKRVFIMENTKDLLPEYLRFVRGLVDSQDLSLNVSREMLQQDSQVQQIKKSLVTKVLNTLKDMKEKDVQTYEKFWTEFGDSLKEGIPNDFSNREKLLELFLVKTTKSDTWTSLKDYVARMKPDQKQIYFLTGENLEHMKSSPHLEALKAKDLEVILFHDHVDEWVVDAITEYQGKPLQSAARENLDLLNETEKAAAQEEKQKVEGEFKSVLEKFKGALSEEIKDVRISDRLTNSAVCLVSGQYDPSARMEKIMSSLGKTDGHLPKRILEINPRHALVQKLKDLPEQQQESWIQILYGQAVLAEGGSLKDPVGFAQKINESLLSH